MDRASPGNSEWAFWINVGGTFTDCLTRHPEGTISKHKLLSSGVRQGPVGRLALFSGTDTDRPCSQRGCLVSLSVTESKTGSFGGPLTRGVPVCRNS